MILKFKIHVCLFVCLFVFVYLFIHSFIHSLFDCLFIHSFDFSIIIIIGYDCAITNTLALKLVFSEFVSFLPPSAQPAVTDPETPFRCLEGEAEPLAPLKPATWHIVGARVCVCVWSMNPRPYSPGSRRVHSDQRAFTIAVFDWECNEWVAK